MAPRTLTDADRELLAATGFTSMRQLEAASTYFACQDYHSDMTWGVVRCPHAEKYFAWCDEPSGEKSWTIHNSWNEAAEHHLEGQKILYEEFHAEYMRDMELEVDIARTYDGDGRIIGWCLSLDSDGASHGCDERYGEF